MLWFIAFVETDSVTVFCDRVRAFLLYYVVAELLYTVHGCVIEWFYAGFVS